MSGKVLIASANPWSFALAVERQFARQHAGSTTDLINLYDLLGSLQPGIRRRDWMIERLNRKIDRFVRPVISGRDISREIQIDRHNIPPLPGRVEEVRAYRVGDAAIGLGALSSAAEITTIYSAERSSEFGDALVRAWRTSHLSHRIGEQAAKRGYDKVLVFGGRHAATRAFTDVLRARTEVICYEQGGSGTRAIYSDGGLYDPDCLARAIASHAHFSRQAGEEFFEQRVRREPGTDSAFFTANQFMGAIPDELRPGEFVTFFTSSPDEMFAVREHVAFGRFPTQFEAAVAIAECCAKEGKRLVVRFHPHLQFKHASWLREWDFERLRSLDALLIMPEDPWDSYALIRASHCVFTSGSTVAFESTYLGTPNAVIGSGVSAALSASAVVQDQREIAEFLSAPHLPDRALDQALLYGSFYRNGGGIEVSDLDVGCHPNFARIDGRIVDPIRYVAQSLRTAAAKAFGSEPSNRSGIVDGRVVLPSGKQYAKTHGNRASERSLQSAR